MRILKGDMVVVCTGDDSGKVARKVLRLEDGGVKVVVENGNRVYRHVKKGYPKSPQGGRLQTELAIDASNVALIDPTTNLPTKVSVRVNEDGSKDLVSRKSGAVVRALSPAKK